MVVRVPVLSEQMTDVQPRVSTDGKDLTMAFFLAIRRVPKARQVVITAGKPKKSNNNYRSNIFLKFVTRNITKISSVSFRIYTM